MTDIETIRHVDKPTVIEVVTQVTEAVEIEVPAKVTEVLEIHSGVRGPRGTDGRQGVDGLPGPIGPQGPKGDGPGLTYAEISHTHVQSIPDKTWTINHNLPYPPTVTVIDSSGSVVDGDVQYLESSVVQIRFSGAFSGTAYLS